MISVFVWALCLLLLSTAPLFLMWRRTHTLLWRRIPPLSPELNAALQKLRSSKCQTFEHFFFFLMDLLIGQHSDNKQETGCTGLEPQATAERTMLLHMGCPPYQRS